MPQKKCNFFSCFYSAIISGGLPVAKAPNENGSDGEERKLGEQTGLDSGAFGVGYFYSFAEKYTE